MEGYLLVPPERSAIIGRAVWKPRYVVLGTIGPPPPTARKPSLPLPRSTSASKLHAARQGLKASAAFQSVDDLSRSDYDQLWLTVLKQKGDSEIISQNPLSSIRGCEIQSISFRKPGPAMPTLILTFELDAASDRMRKRRSSRSGQLTSPSSTFPNSLLFRSLPDERLNIYDWQVTIAPRIRPSTADRGDISSNDSTSLFTFVNPFANSPKPSERPIISNPIPQPEPFLHHRSSTKDHRPPPKAISMVSPSPSLRSRHSDLSSPASSFSPSGPLPIQHPPLPSPSSTLTHDTDLISGWTSAQGRTSALSHHTYASTPPAPRETILDRAFSLRYIPGAADGFPSEEGKLSSIARFEALMREHEARKHRPTAHHHTNSASAWDLDEASESESDAESDIDPYAPRNRRIDTPENPHVWNMQTVEAPAHRALGYISGRSTPASVRPGSARSEIHPPMPMARMRIGENRRARPASLSLAGMGTRQVATVSHTTGTAKKDEEENDDDDDDEEEEDEDDNAEEADRDESDGENAEDSDDTEADLDPAAFPQPPQSPPLRSQTVPPPRVPLSQRHSNASSYLIVQTNATSSTVPSSRNSHNSDASSSFGLGSSENGSSAEIGIARGLGLSQARMSVNGMGRLIARPVVVQKGASDDARCRPGAGSGVGAGAGGWRPAEVGVEGGFL